MAVAEEHLEGVRSEVGEVFNAQFFQGRNKRQRLFIGFHRIGIRLVFISPGNDVPEHREVIDNSGLYFHTKDSENLVEQIQFMVDNPEIIAEKRKMAIDRIKQNYTWDKITEDYEKLFKNLLNGEAK